VCVFFFTPDALSLSSRSRSSVLKISWRRALSSVEDLRAVLSIQMWRTVRLYHDWKSFGMFRSVLFQKKIIYMK
jgi:hypothetical protein